MDRRLVLISLNAKWYDNPFAVHRVLRVRYELDAAEWRTLLNRFAALGHRGAIIGPHRTGKTTLLEDLATQLAARGWGPHWVQLNADSRDIGDRLRSVAKARLDRHDAVWVDGAEQVAPLAWPSHINQLT